MSVQPGYYSRLDRMNGLGEPLTEEEGAVTFPGGWFVLALIAAAIGIWWSLFVLAAIGCFIAGCARVAIHATGGSQS